jgi:hypothetical protein
MNNNKKKICNNCKNIITNINCTLNNIGCNNLLDYCNLVNTFKNSRVHEKDIQHKYNMKNANVYRRFI